MDRRMFHLIALMLLTASYQTVAPWATAGSRNHQADPPPMYVLQVGIGRYADGKIWPALSGSVNDVLEMKKLLMSQRFNVPVENIHTLVDERATKNEIFREFKTHLIDNARSYFEKTRRRDAVVLFQFSGHGSQVPDMNGDENDKLDETFVPFDSSDEPGKNFDITDDEIFELTAQLRRYTENIIYILDSCHSGTGTRDSKDSRQLAARKTTPVSMPNREERGEKAQKPKDNEQTDLLPPGDDYVVISAARAEEFAIQKPHFADEKSKVPVMYGYLTFYLIDELRKVRSNTSYRELMENVSRRVTTERTSQTPQLEGDGSRYVFGGLGSREDEFIRLLDAGKNTVTIRAGSMHGVLPGSVLAVYDKTVTEFANADKIATAKIQKIMADRSIAEITAASRDLMIEDKAVVVSPDLGSIRLRVYLDMDEAKLTAQERSVVQTLRREFSSPSAGQPDPNGIEIVENKRESVSQPYWDLALLKDGLDKVVHGRAVSVEKGARREDGAATLSNKPVFYLAAKDFVPLYEFHVETDRTDAALKIGSTLRQLARLRSVKAISNPTSPLKGKIKITPFRYSLATPPCDSDGKIITVGKSIPALNGGKTAFKLDQREAFWLEITNNSRKDLYLMVLDIGNDGSVKILAPRKRAGEKDEGLKLTSGETSIVPGASCRDGALTTTPPAGTETFKIVASTAPIKREDFEFLEMDAIKRGEMPTLTKFADWTTAEINFEISSERKP